MLEAWEKRLRLAEEDLREREREALAHDPSPSALLAFAAERDTIAIDRDSLATSYDERATARDRASLDRDVAGSGRDKRARAWGQDRDVGFADRSAAGKDRDFGAGDRTDSYDDRARGREARGRATADRARAADDRDRAAEMAAGQDRELDGLRAALESRLVIGQAQGLLIARHEVSTETAFAVLSRLSQETNTKLRDVAAQLVAEAQPSDG